MVRFKFQPHVPTGNSHYQSVSALPNCSVGRATHASQNQVEDYRQSMNGTYYTELCAQSEKLLGLLTCGSSSIIQLYFLASSEACLDHVTCFGH